MTTNLKRSEARTRSELLTLDSSTTVLDLSQAADSSVATYLSDTTVVMQANAAATTFIDFIADAVTQVTINGMELDPASAFDGARVTFPVRPGTNTLRVVGNAVYSRSGEGLHRFVDPADSKVYLYTQYEPTDARRVFANFDQPDLKTRFTFCVLAPADFTVLNTTARIGEASEVSPGVLRHDFAPTEVQSSYITCVCAGHYASARDTYTHPRTGETIDLGLFTRASLAEHMDAEQIFGVTKQGLDFFHEQFDYPYPWGKYDQIFVPEYNLGAMENPGLVTFTDSYIYRDAVTRNMYESRTNTIMHEMAHMWFGDLVTMQWWDDLWLKESFADYMGGLALAEASEFTDGWVSFALRRKDWAYRQDQYPTTHPIVADIPDVEAAKLNFDGITYAKGASVLKELVAYVGRDAFMAGSRAYFRKHAFSNTTLADFLDALHAAAPDRDVRGWAEAWLKTTGISELSLAIDTDEAGRITSAVVSQHNSDATAEAPGTLRPHRLQLAAISLHAGTPTPPEVTGTWEIDFADASAPVPGLLGLDRPDVLLLNHGDDDFVKVRLDPTSTQALLDTVSELPDAMDRALVWSALGNATRDGLLPVADFLRAYAGSLGRETHPGINAALRAQMLTALDRWAAPREVDAHLDAVLAAGLAALAEAEAGSDLQLDLASTVLALVRRSARVASLTETVAAGREYASHVLTVEVGERLATWAPGLKVDHALRWNALSGLVGLGWADVDDIDAEASLDRSGSGALNTWAARAARPLPIVKMRTFTEITENRELSNDKLSAKISGFVAPSAQPLLEAYVDRYFELLESFWSTRSIEIARRLVLGLFPSWSIDPERVLELTDAWLAEHAQAPNAQRRLLLEARDDLARSIRLREQGRPRKH